MNCQNIASSMSVRRCISSEAALRRMRQKIWDFDGTPREAQAERVLQYLKKRVIRTRKQLEQNAPRGPYSGLTKRELAMTRTCETDWF